MYPARELTRLILSRLTVLFQGITPFQFVFQRVNQFPQAGVLYLEPEPAGAFTHLHRQLQTAFPECIPDFCDPTMHATVAQGYDLPQLSWLETKFHQSYRNYLPIQENATAAHLYVKVANQWSMHSVFSFSSNI